MIVILKNGYVVSYATIGNIVGGIEVPEPEDLEAFENHYQAYKLVNNELVYDEEHDRDLDLENFREQIRQRRERECFAIIDRSKLWYDRLTSEQLDELNDWYSAWLLAPETFEIPEKPEWL